MTTVLAHALVLTLDQERRILTDGAVAFDAGGTLRQVGLTADVLSDVPANATVIDCAGTVITPGFVDVHVHLGEQLARGLVPDSAGPQEWLPEWLLPMYSALTPEDEELSAELAIAEMLLTGTTAFCEAGTLLDWEAGAEAVSRAGIRGQLARWTSDDGPPILPRIESVDEAIEQNATMVDRVRQQSDDHLTAAVVLLGLGTGSEQLMREAAALADDRDAMLAMMYASVHPDHGGWMFPVSGLEDLGWLQPRTKLTHAVYVDSEDVARLADHRVKIAHCPSAALRHVKGLHRYGRIPEMLEAGMSVGLGGDSANGSNHYDMLKLMYLAATLYKDFRMDPAMVPPESALEMATRHGAECLGLQDRIGSLEVGKQADLVVFSTDHPEWRPLLHPVQNLVLNAPDRSIRSVWVGGRKVVEAGQVLTLDVNDLLQRADRASHALLDRIGLRAPWDWPHHA